MTAPKDVVINGNEYLIQCHPGEEGLILAWQLNKLIGKSVYESQKVLSSAMDSLSEDERKELMDGSDEEKAEKFEKVMLEKVDTAQMLDTAIKLLEGIDARAMAVLCKDMFKHVNIKNKTTGQMEKFNINTHLFGNYEDVIPLFGEVAELNGFFALDATDLLRVR